MRLKVQSSHEFLTGPFDMALVFAAVLIFTLEASVATRALHPRNASDAARLPALAATPTLAAPSLAPTAALSSTPSRYRVVVALPPLR